MKPDFCFACGDRPRIDTEKGISATWIECPGCRRVCGAKTREEAVIMWNGAMKALETKAMESIR